MQRAVLPHSVAALGCLARFFPSATSLLPLRAVCLTGLHPASPIQIACVCLPLSITNYPVCSPCAQGISSLETEVLPALGELSAKPFLSPSILSCLLLIHSSLCFTQGISNLETQVLPALEELSAKLNQLGTSAMSWEQVEEMLMLPLQPRSRSLTANRRWVRQDFRMRRKMFLEEVAKLAVEGPVHKMEIRRARLDRGRDLGVPGDIDRQALRKADAPAEPALFC